MHDFIKKSNRKVKAFNSQTTNQNHTIYDSIFYSGD